MPFIGGSTAASSTNGGKVYGFNNIADGAAVVVAPKSTERKTITFFNPGTHDLFIHPRVAQTTGLDVTLTPTSAALGGSIRVMAGSFLNLTGECSGPWLAFAAAGSGATNPLTVMDSNV